MHTQNADFDQFIYEGSPTKFGKSGQGRGGMLVWGGGKRSCLDHIYKVRLSNFTVHIICYYYYYYYYYMSLINWGISPDLSSSFY